MKWIKQLSKFTIFQIILYPIALGYIWYLSDVMKVPALYSMATWGIIGAAARFVVNRWFIFNEVKK